MAFNPSSTLYLCNVPIDNTYKHQILPLSEWARDNYFSQRVVKTFANYLTVRKSLPNGSNKSAVRVNANIDDLYNCNYMYYQNANHGTRKFFAFITDLIYINENTTEIVFETDVVQTWALDCTIHPSYVVREHTATDVAGDNIVPESFHFENYQYKEVFPVSPFTKFPTTYGYLIGTSEFVPVLGTEMEFRGSYQSGIYQGLFFYYFTDLLGVSTFLQTAESVSDCVQFIACIPSFCVSNANFAGDQGYGLMGSTAVPASSMVAFSPLGEGTITFGGYAPKNRKLYTSPFCNFIITNNAGNEAVYNLEDFFAYGCPSFYMKGDISTNPSVTLYPDFYKGAQNNVSAGISLGNFPQCSFNSDTYKLWLAKNQFGVGLDLASGLAQIVGGALLAAGTGGMSLAVGGGSIIGGIQSVTNTINGVYQASKQPNGSTAGAPKNNLLTAMGMNTYRAFVRTINREYAETIDNFFTLYGYQVNKLKEIDLYNRKYYTYIQTANVNITGAIPQDDLSKLKSVFDSGVTFWEHSATVGDYSVNNIPRSEM